MHTPPSKSTTLPSPLSHRPHPNLAYEKLVKRTRDEKKDNMRTVLACLRVCYARISHLADLQYEYMYMSPSIALPGFTR